VLLGSDGLAVACGIDAFDNAILQNVPDEGTTYTQVSAGFRFIRCFPTTSYSVFDVFGPWQALH
jgi:hypothetical protein